MSSFDLKDRVALISGGAGGIGVSVARRFADAGAHIALADIRKDAVAQAAGELKDLGFRAIGLVADVSNPDDADSLIEQTVAEYGQLDILVNNAGYMGRAAPLWELGR